MQASGAARTEIAIVDFSQLVDTVLKGRLGIGIVTERGEIGKLYNLATWEDYQVELGDLIATDDGPLYAKRALDKGTPLTIVPIGKYADPSNPSSLSGAKAAYTATQSAVSAAGATAVVTMSVPAVPASEVVSIYAKAPGLSDLILGSVTLTNSSTLSAAVTAIQTAVNANTGSTGYSVAGNTTTGVFTFTAPVAYGAWGNNATLQIVAGTGIIFDNFIKKFTGGVDTTTTGGTITVTAKAKGAKYNDVRLYFTSAVSNDINKYDIKVSLLNSKAPDEYLRDVPKLASDATLADMITGFIANSRLISALTVSAGYVFQPITITLVNGTNGTAPSASDYMGNRGAQTNMYAFDNSSEITKICIPAMADPILAKQLADYVDDRQDIMGLHRTPIGITPERALDYRYGTGSYNHIPIDSFRNLMFGGELIITDPRTGLKKIISPIGDILSNFARKDQNYHEWFSFAGETRGKIIDILGLNYNVGGLGMKDLANRYDAAGVIPVIQNTKKLVYISGDNTLYRKETLLKKSNVVEGLIFTYRSIMELIPQNFDPNDIDLWKECYRKIQPFLEYMKNNRAFHNYSYAGDQDIMDISQAVINKPENIDSGKVRIIIGVQPVVNAKYFDITIAVANSGTSLESIVERAS